MTFNILACVSRGERCTPFNDGLTVRFCRKKRCVYSSEIYGVRFDFDDSVHAERYRTIPVRTIPLRTARVRTARIPANGAKYAAYTTARSRRTRRWGSVMLSAVVPLTLPLTLPEPWIDQAARLGNTARVVHPKTRNKKSCSWRYGRSEADAQTTQSKDKIYD